jgi:hypothetical protein
VALLILAIPGSLRMARVSPRLTQVVLTIFALWFVVHAVYHGQQRFHIALLPLFCALAAQARPAPECDRSQSTNPDKGYQARSG